MQNIILWKQGEDSWIRWIKKRIKNNLNFLAILEGSTGSGKSWSALSIAYALDPEFNPRKQVAFTFKDLMHIINKFNGMDKEDNSLSNKDYKVCIFDEAQTSLSNKEWQSRVNKIFNYLISTFRHQNIILLFTSPYSDFIDSASMKLLHAKFEIKSWNKKTNKTLIRPKILQYNSKLKKFYEHSLFVIRDKRTFKLVNWLVNRPPEHLVIPYEEMKTAFTNNLNREITEELEQMDQDKHKDKQIDNRTPLDPSGLQFIIWNIAQKGYRTQQELADEVGKVKGRIVTQDEISRGTKAMLKKGYNVLQYKQK